MDPHIYTSKDHHIRNSLIDKNALYVLDKLHHAGYLAYLVGGGVRDLLLNKKPKDFDISTSAKPEEIKKVFPRALLIGRRFRLAHVRFGRQIIEVSTFRAGDPEDSELIVRDNLWGSPEEDVLRRDFTINGLYYDPQKHEIIDYVGGLNDLKKHLLKAIGDPIVRFKQDPVRMIRMQKFRARFGFHADNKAEEALALCKKEITKSSSARVLEEILRMLESGAAAPFFKLLADADILPLLFPKLGPLFQKEESESLFAYLKGVDAMNTQGRYRSLDRSILTAALIFPLLEQRVAALLEKKKKPPHLGEIFHLTQEVMHDMIVDAFAHFPKRLRFGAKAICEMQYRLTPIDKEMRPKTRIVRHKEFSKALTFLKLRSLIHHPLFKKYQYWKGIKQGESPPKEA